MGLSVCVCVCLLSHIPPMERLFVLKTLSRTQRATKVKKFVGICLKRLRSRVMPRNMSEKANMLIIPTYRCQLFPLDTQRSKTCSMRQGFALSRSACAARLTVVGLCECASVCLSTTILVLQATMWLMSDINSFSVATTQIIK